MGTFTILVLTQTLSIIGSGISGLVVCIRVYADTGNATPLALVAFFAALPRMLAAGLARDCGRRAPPVGAPHALCAHKESSHVS